MKIYVKQTGTYGMDEKLYLTLFFGMWLFIHVLDTHLLYIKTRTTRTPSFWGYPPPPHDYPHYWVILDPKSKKNSI